MALLEAVRYRFKVLTSLGLTRTDGIDRYILSLWKAIWHSGVHENRDTFFNVSKNERQRSADFDTNLFKASTLTVR